MYESVRDAPETANKGFTWGTVTRKLETRTGSLICKTRQWRKFEFADSIAENVMGGVIDCAFEKGKPVGEKKCTFMVRSMLARCLVILKLGAKIAKIFVTMRCTSSALKAKFSGTIHSNTLIAIV